MTPVAQTPEARRKMIGDSAVVAGGIMTVGSLALVLTEHDPRTIGMCALLPLSARVIERFLPISVNAVYGGMAVGMLSSVMVENSNLTYLIGAAVTSIATAILAAHRT